MNYIIKLLKKYEVLESDLDYHVVRASMVLIFLFFGYQKWWPYEAQVLIPYISNGPLIFWMYPVFGVRGATYFLGVSEWLFGALLLLGFWNKKLGLDSLALWGRVLHLYQPSPFCHSCQVPGLRPLADFLQ
jgi:uncharacterized membrane protein YkgB